MFMNKLNAAIRDPNKIIKFFIRISYKIINTIALRARIVKRIPIILLKRCYRILPLKVKSFVSSSIIADKIRASQSIGARFFLPPGLTPIDFFKTLNDRKITYVLLRWWQTFPIFPTGEDFDVLIADSDRRKINDLLVRSKNNYKCDIYTETGIYSGDYHGLPYFSAKLSDELLKNRKLYNNCVYVPDESTYFASLLYHVLFHKTEQLFSNKFLDHNYSVEILSLAGQLGEKVEVTPDSIYQYLKLEDFKPSEDVIAKLIVYKPELEYFYQPLSCDSRRGCPGIFLVREEAINNNLLPEIIEILTMQFGLELLYSLPLSGRVRANVELKCRGGKWDRGPYAKSGGGPVHALIYYDHYPQPLNSRQILKYPSVTNQKILQIKAVCRDLVFNWNFWFNYFNAIHSADNERETIEYINTIDQSLIEPILDTVESHRELFYTQYPVKKILSEGKRSKVELIEFNGELAIKKTFKTGCERFLNREIFATEVLSKKMNFIPKLLFKSDNFLIIPYIDSICDVKAKKNFLLQYRHLIKGVIQSMYDEGLDYINFTPENIIITEGGKFHAIDFEFLQPISECVSNIEQTAMVNGYVEGFDGDLPLHYPGYQSHFNAVWLPFIGKY